MKNETYTGFSIHDDGSIPVVLINGVKMALKSLVYKWETRTAEGVGINVCIVEGYLNDDPTLRRYVFDTSTKMLKKETPDNEKDSGISG